MIFDFENLSDVKKEQLTHRTYRFMNLSLHLLANPGITLSLHALGSKQNDGDFGPSSSDPQTRLLHDTVADVDHFSQMYFKNHPALFDDSLPANAMPKLELYFPRQSVPASDSGAGNLLVLPERLYPLAAKLDYPDPLAQPEAFADWRKTLDQSWPTLFDFLNGLIKDYPDLEEQHGSSEVYETGDLAELARDVLAYPNKADPLYDLREVLDVGGMSLPESGKIFGEILPEFRLPPLASVADEANFLKYKLLRQETGGYEGYSGDGFSGYEGLPPLDLSKEFYVYELSSESPSDMSEGAGQALSGSDLVRQVSDAGGQSLAGLEGAGQALSGSDLVRQVSGAGGQASAEVLDSDLARLPLLLAQLGQAHASGGVPAVLQKAIVYALRAILRNETDVPTTVLDILSAAAGTDPSGISSLLLLAARKGVVAVLDSLSSLEEGEVVDLPSAGSEQASQPSDESDAPKTKRRRVGSTENSGAGSE